MAKDSKSKDLKIKSNQSADDKAKALQTAIGQIEKQFGKGAIMRLANPPKYKPAKAKKKGITVKEVDQKKLDFMTGGATHQGIVAIAAIKEYSSVEDILALAKEREEELRTRYAKPFIDNAKVFGQMMSIVPEAAVAIKSGASAMHDVSEGGIFGALWELAESAGVGLEIDIKKIPISKTYVKKVSEMFMHLAPKMSEGAE